MPRHDQTRNHARRRTWFGRVLLAWTFLAGAIAPGPARAQDASTGSRAHWRDPVELAARRVWYWSIGSDQFVLLDGEVAVQQSTEIVRTDQAVARVRTVTTESGPSYTVDVFTEARPAISARSSAQPAMKFSWISLEAPRINPYTKDGFHKLGGPPTRVALWARSGFGAQPPAPPAARTARQPKPRPAGPRPTTRDVAFEPVPDSATAAPPSPAVAAQAVMRPVADPDALPASIEKGIPLAPGEEATPPEVAGAETRRATRDRKVRRTQFGAPMGFDGTDDPAASGPQAQPPPIDIAPLDSAPTVPALTSPADDDEPPTNLAPLPAPGSETESKPSSSPKGKPKGPKPPYLPFIPGSQRVTRIFPRNGTSMLMERLRTANGLDTTVVRGGVNIITESPQLGIVDIVADNAVIWRKVDEKGHSYMLGPAGEQIDDPDQPLEVYLEGNIVIRQDEHKLAGTGDQKTIFAKRAFYDLRSERLVALDSEVNMYAPGLVAPMRLFSPRIDQYQPLERRDDGKYVYGLAQIRADKTVTTGSRFAKPGYRFNSRSVDLFRIIDKDADPKGKAVGPDNPGQPDLTWHIDARQNVFYMGWVPVFYWPRFVADADDLEPPLRQFAFRTNNYFGQQVLFDFNGFRLLGMKKPKNIDLWNLDLDYLSARTKTFPALGTELGWFGSDLVNDFSDPYGRVKNKPPSAFHSYFGYLDVWGLRDYGTDTLGTGPAIITNNIKAGKAGYQRGGGGKFGSVPAFQDYRGRFSFRHMQRLVPDDDEIYDDFRFQLEVGFTSDRYFLEEYYKRLFDVGMDQETLAYVVKQKDNTAWTLWTEANLQSWQTETQWLPKGDYYRLGDSLLGNRMTYFQHSGIDYANVHTASEVNNPNIFAFIPYDPISNTSRSWSSGRAYSSHEVDMPLNFFDNLFRIVPYAQGQAVGWTNQINGQELGRIWGAAGVRAEIMAWKVYPSVQSEMFNVHGINHKINVEADFRSAYSNVNLNSIGVQDDLDDNTYESTRRYFALTNYAGGLLPAMYDPRFFILRRAMSPITGPNDIQATMETLHLGIHQRLQTKRGPEGHRRIIDYMTLDLDTTYFPYASRDNFNKPFGQNTYNWQWFLGDRMSVVSYGWFEFWNIGGNPIYSTNINRANNPFGLNVITSGIALNRPPRGNIFIGYTVINTGPINTSALNFMANYWMSPKWYGTYSTMYDFGNGILLAGVLSLTRIGPDYITSVGLTVDPQRQSYMFAFQLSPRLSPNMRLGSGVSSSNFDSRYAPTQ